MFHKDPNLNLSLVGLKNYGKLLAFMKIFFKVISKGIKY